MLAWQPLQIQMGPETREKARRGGWLEDVDVVVQIFGDEFPWDSHGVPPLLNQGAKRHEHNG